MIKTCSYFSCNKAQSPKDGVEPGYPLSTFTAYSCIAYIELISLLLMLHCSRPQPDTDQGTPQGVAPSYLSQWHRKNTLVEEFPVKKLLFVSNDEITFVGFKITPHSKITFHPIGESSNLLFRYNNHFFQWQLWSIIRLPQAPNQSLYFQKKYILF